MQLSLNSPILSTLERKHSNESERVDQAAFAQQAKPYSPTEMRDRDVYLKADMLNAAEPHLDSKNVYDEIDIDAVDVGKTLHKSTTNEAQSGGINPQTYLGIAAHARSLPQIPESTKSSSAPTAETPPPRPTRRFKEKQAMKPHRNPSQPAQAKVKVTVVGDETVGKTCLLTAIVEGICPVQYVPTETDDCLVKMVQVNDDKIGIGLWDLSGSRDFDRMRPENYAKTDVIIICFSIASPATFDSVLTRWQPEVVRHCPGIPIILVGTKADLRNDKIAIETLRYKRLAPISKSQAVRLAKEIGAVLYVECSALTRQGLDAVFGVALQTVFGNQSLMKFPVFMSSQLDSTWASVLSGQSAQHASSFASDSDEHYKGMDHGDTAGQRSASRRTNDCEHHGSSTCAGTPETHISQSPIVPHPVPKPRRSICKEPDDASVERRQESIGSAEEEMKDRIKDPISKQKEEEDPPSSGYHSVPVASENPDGCQVYYSSNEELRKAKTSPEAKELTIPVPRTMQEGKAGPSIPDGHQIDQLYPVTSPQGFCLIVNIRTYKNQARFKERLGSEFDVKRVKDVFTKLNFVVRVHEDLTCNEVAELLSITALSPELKSHGCFVCFIMAHGAGSSIFGIDGEALEIESITDRFRANQCHRLRHKPKLFFIQACRGNEHPDNIKTATVDHQESDVYYCPKDIDFMLCFASPSGQASLRTSTEGSPFVQIVCSVIDEMYKSEHLINMLTIANGRLKRNPVYREGNQAFVVSETLTRLSKKCFLDPELAFVFSRDIFV